MLTNVSDQCLLGWLNGASRSCCKVGRDDVFKRVAQKAARALGLPNTYVGPIATSLAHMWGRGDLEIADGILQVSSSKSKQMAAKPMRRPAALARRQELGIGSVPIYQSLDDDQGASNATSVGAPERRQYPMLGQARFIQGGTWLAEFVARERAALLAAAQRCAVELSMLDMGYQVSCDSFGFPQELAHLEQVNGGGRLVEPAPACI